MLRRRIFQTGPQVCAFAGHMAPPIPTGANHYHHHHRAFHHGFNQQYHRSAAGSGGNSNGGGGGGGNGVVGHAVPAAPASPTAPIAQARTFGGGSGSRIAATPLQRIDIAIETVLRKYNIRQGRAIPLIVSELSEEITDLLADEGLGIKQFVEKYPYKYTIRKMPNALNVHLLEGLDPSGAGNFNGTPRGAVGGTAPYTLATTNSGGGTMGIGDAFTVLEVGGRVGADIKTNPTAAAHLLSQTRGFALEKILAAKRKCAVATPLITVKGDFHPVPNISTLKLIPTRSIESIIDSAAARLMISDRLKEIRPLVKAILDVEGRILYHKKVNAGEIPSSSTENASNFDPATVAKKNADLKPRTFFQTSHRYANVLKDLEVLFSLDKEMIYLYAIPKQWHGMATKGYDVYYRQLAQHRQQMEHYNRQYHHQLQQQQQRSQSGDSLDGPRDEYGNDLSYRRHHNNHRGNDLPPPPPPPEAPKPPVNRIPILEGHDVLVALKNLTINPSLFHFYAASRPAYQYLAYIQTEERELIQSRELPEHKQQQASDSSNSSSQMRDSGRVDAITLALEDAVEDGLETHIGFSPETGMSVKSPTEAAERYELSDWHVDSNHTPTFRLPSRLVVPLIKDRVWFMDTRRVRGTSGLRNVSSSSAAATPFEEDTIVISELVDRKDPKRIVPRISDYGDGKIIVKCPPMALVEPYEWHRVARHLSVEAPLPIGEVLRRTQGVTQQSLMHVLLSNPQYFKMERERDPAADTINVTNKSSSNTEAGGGGGSANSSPNGGDGNGSSSTNNKGNSGGSSLAPPTYSYITGVQFLLNELYVPPERRAGSGETFSTVVKKIKEISEALKSSPEVGQMQLKKRLPMKKERKRLRVVASTFRNGLSPLLDFDVAAQTLFDALGPNPLSQEDIEASVPQWIQDVTHCTNLKFYMAYKHLFRVFEMPPKLVVQCLDGVTVTAKRETDGNGLTDPSGASAGLNAHIPEERLTEGQMVDMVKTTICEANAYAQAQGRHPFITHITARLPRFVKDRIKRDYGNLFEFAKKYPEEFALFEARLDGRGCGGNDADEAIRQIDKTTIQIRALL